MQNRTPGAIFEPAQVEKCRLNRGDFLAVAAAFPVIRRDPLFPRLLTTIGRVEASAAAASRLRSFRDDG